MPTPYYELYKALSSISGKADVQSEYLTIYDQETTSIILNNTSSELDVRFNIKFFAGSKPKYIVKRSFTGSKALQHIINEFTDSETSDYRLRKYIFDFISGSLDFILTDPHEYGRHDIAVPPKTFIILTFSNI